MSYEYDTSTFNNGINVDQLADEISSDSNIQTELISVQLLGTVVEILFAELLNQKEQLALDGLIIAHDINKNCVKIFSTDDIEARSDSKLCVYGNSIEVESPNLITISGDNIINRSANGFVKSQPNIISIPDSDYVATVGDLLSELWICNPTAPIRINLPTFSDINSFISGLNTRDSIDFYVVNEGMDEVQIFADIDSGGFVGQDIIEPRTSGHFRLWLSTSSSYSVFRLS